MKTNALVFSLIMMIQFSALSQLKSNYARGFEVGFKEGYCYNNSTVDCFYPLTPEAPLPRINEDKEDYTQGYNRGFQFGLDLKRSKTALSNSDATLNNQILRFNEYIPQNPVEAMAYVGIMKQKKYDARKEWIQLRINQLGELLNNLTNELSKSSNYDVTNLKVRVWNVLVEYTKKIGSIDFADDYQFNAIQNNFTRIEKYFYNSFNEIVIQHQTQSKNSKGTNQMVVVSKEVGIYFDRAEAAYDKGEHKVALENINYAIKLDPDYSESFQIRGLIYRDGYKDYEKALKDFTKFIELDPTRSHGYFLRGTVYEEMKNGDEAIKDFTQALKLDPKNVNAYFLRGCNKFDLDDINGALNDFNQIISRYSGSEASMYIFKKQTLYYWKANCLLELQDYNEGIKSINIALEIDDTRSQIWETRGELYYKLGNYLKCIEDMSSAIRIDGESRSSLYFRGLSKIKLGKKLEGCDDLRKAQQLGSKFAGGAISENCN